ncbi:Contactin-2-like [Homarus americanus]|uniref:Contactin-2-like n=1 Tax=Homarus americanus TaxID=6706 RepID=A0A8J5JCK7_HOMAM|nr:Contactin-2-like [Homarus americanus]
MEESGYDGDEEEIDYGEPPEFAMGPQHLVAKEGDTININCQPNEELKKAATETSKAKILFVGDVKVQRNRRYKLNGHMVEISNIRASDAGTYICSVETQPPLELKMISEAEQHVLKGESVRLECQSEGNPTPTIHWSRQEGRLPSGAHEEEAIVRTGEGDKVELVCIVHSRPTAEVTWSKDGQTLTLDNHLEEQNGGHRHSLRISQVTEEDFGEYVCTAANEHGTVRASIHMTGQPKPPHFTSDPNGGEETSYTLTWETESYYPILQYRLTYRKAKANDSTDEPGEWHDNTYEATDMETQGLMHYMKHTINDLEPATDYHAIILVKNKFMWGANTEFAFSTKKVPPTTTPTTSTTTTTQTTTTTPLTTTTFVGDTEGPSLASSKEVAVERKTSGAPSTFTCFLPIFLLPVLLLRT